ncbi:MAG: hypothetical protein HY882_13465 [Deltaproteobacteria bacterium]|nr:hypothetical protein [Deltaproteobacteria bacterium]
MNMNEPWVVGYLPGKGRRIAIIAHMDEAYYWLVSVDDNGVATFDGVYAWGLDQNELTKFIDYEELRSAPIVRNPNGEAILTINIPELKASLPVYSWKVLDMQHQRVGVQLTNEQAVFCRNALSKNRSVIAINQCSVRRVQDPAIGELVLGSPLDNRVGVAIILGLARHYANLSPGKRPNLYFVARPREECQDASTFLTIDPIIDAHLVIVIDDPAPIWYPILGGGPVVVWHPDRTPQRVMDIIVQLKQKRKQIFKAPYETFLTAVANDAGSKVPAILIGPTMLRYHSSEEKMAVADITDSVELIIRLIERIAE